MADPTSKAALLDRMQESYTAFEALLAPLNTEQLCTPGVNGEWSIKDILVHLTVWQKRVSTWLEALTRHQESPLDPIDDDKKMNAFNDATFAANRARPLSEVQADFRATVQRLEEQTRRTEQDDLFTPGRFAWFGGEPLWKNIAGNTFEHYEEHAPVIQVWLADQR